MRDIKFRGWNKTDKKMIDMQKITPLALDDNMNTQLAARGESGLFLLFSDEVELMQYTGLKDFNGIEIYEGDILDEKYKWKVEYKNDVFWGVAGLAECINSGMLYSLLQSRERAGCPMEIIGNIYENENLLNG